MSALTGAGIEARGLLKMFEDVVAVAELDLTIDRGQVYGLIGPNGAGKTTTQRMLAGLLQPTAGEISIAGQDPLRSPLEVKRRVGFLTASTGLYGRLTPRELADFFGRLYGLQRAEIRQRVSELAEELGLEELLDRRCERLSSGQRQRVSLLRATLHRPAVLILDEPTARLDVLASRSVARFIAEQRNAGATVLLSTHYLSEAELLCDRVGLLHCGRLLAEGTPAALRGEHSTLEAAFLAAVERGERAAGPGPVVS
ncbi:MAG: ABC transporter ATP-binding protein [Deltaproteobacteria bacterium]|nr:ABC transporter ATP-binding protein [Deltaproteobacteria bacterium]